LILNVIKDKLSWVITSPVNWKGIMQLFAGGVTVFESYLLLRQFPYYSKPQPPAALASHFTSEVFAKSQSYGRDKAVFSLISTIYKGLLDQVVLYFDFYPWCWRVAGLLLAKFGYSTEYEIPHSILYCFIMFFLTWLPTIPLSVYSTFVVEAKHGFNKTTVSTFVLDYIKTWGLGFVIGAPFLAAFLKIVQWAGDRFVPWLMGFMVAFQLVLVIIYPTLIQPLFNKLSPLPDGGLRTRIESLASKLHFPLKHLYEIDGSKRSSHSNAYFFGLPWSKHIVIFDTLIKQSTVPEVEAVLAHELGHWYYMHPTKLLLVSQVHLFSILAIFPVFLHSPPFLRSFGFPQSVAAKPPIIVAFLLYQSILAPTEAVIGMLNNSISRRMEYAADEFAAVDLQSRVRATGGDTNGMEDMGERLGKALVGLHVENLSTVWVDWLYSAYHHSHPTLTERLRALDVLRAGRVADGIKKEL